MEVPDGIVKAAEQIGTYFVERKIENWAVGPVRQRFGKDDGARKVSMPTHVMEQQIAVACRRAVAAEREACARIAETWAEDHKTVQPSFSGMAAAIRDRGHNRFFIARQQKLPVDVMAGPFPQTAFSMLS